MISDESRYAFLTKQIEYHSRRMGETFKWYAQLAVIILGGFLWAESQAQSETARKVAHTIAGDLIVLLGIFSITLIWFDFVRWFGYRKAETKMMDGKIDPPVFPDSAWQEIITTVAIFASGIAAHFVLR